MFSMSNQVTVSSMQVTATTSGGIYQSAPSAQKNWLATPISEPIVAQVAPTVVKTFSADATVFQGNYSDSASVADVGVGSHENVDLTTEYSVGSSATGYTGTFAVETAPAAAPYSTHYAADTKVAAAMHFFLAIEGTTGATKNLNCSVKYTAASGETVDAAATIRGAVAIEIHTRKADDTWTSAVVMLDTIGSTNTTVTIPDAIVETMTDGGTEVWILMYLKGDDDACTTNAANLYEIVDVLDFTFTTTDKQ